jgi:hypothetical protein
LFKEDNKDPEIIEVGRSSDVIDDEIVKTTKKAKSRKRHRRQRKFSVSYNMSVFHYT